MRLKTTGKIFVSTKVILEDWQFGYLEGNIFRKKIKGLHYLRFPVFTGEEFSTEYIKRK